MTERGFDRMKVFDAKAFDISEAGNPALADLYYLLREAMSERSEEEREIDRKFEGVYSELLKSINPNQEKLFELFLEQMDEDQLLEGQRQFVCGFKTAMRLTLESMK